MLGKISYEGELTEFKRELTDSLRIGNPLFSGLQGSRVGDFWFGSSGFDLSFFFNSGPDRKPLNT